MCSFNKYIIHELIIIGLNREKADKYIFISHIRINLGKYKDRIWNFYHFIFHFLSDHILILNLHSCLCFIIHSFCSKILTFWVISLCQHSLQSKLMIGHKFYYLLQYVYMVCQYLFWTLSPLIMLDITMFYRFVLIMKPMWN